MSSTPKTVNVSVNDVKFANDLMQHYSLELADELRAVYKKHKMTTGQVIALCLVEIVDAVAEGADEPEFICSYMEKFNDLIHQMTHARYDALRSMKNKSN